MTVNTIQPVSTAFHDEQRRPDAVAVEIGLNAAIVAMVEYQPHILAIRQRHNSKNDNLLALPFGLFEPLKHRTLEISIRDRVHEQTKLELGYVEQLYTFGDRGRHASPSDNGQHVVSIGYLALVEGKQIEAHHPLTWSAWYDHFPWEDWRQGKPSILTKEMEPRLADWAKIPEPPDAPNRALSRFDRIKICFGQSVPWDDERVLERYELLYEAGLVTEAEMDGRQSAHLWLNLPLFGKPMSFDHRRIVATAMSRLRAKLKYRPVIFELMPENFTLFELQRAVEAILGSYLHKQNFRRLVDSSGLVELVEDLSVTTGGRPARLYRFRKNVLLERPAPGVRVKIHHNNKGTNHA